MKALLYIPSNNALPIEQLNREVDWKELGKLTQSGAPNAIYQHVGATYFSGGLAFAVHEEGLLHGLPFNSRAAQLANQELVGDVVLVEFDQEDF